MNANGSTYINDAFIMSILCSHAVIVKNCPETDMSKKDCLIVNVPNVAACVWCRVSTRAHAVLLYGSDVVKGTK